MCYGPDFLFDVHVASFGMFRYHHWHTRCKFFLGSGNLVNIAFLFHLVCSASCLTTMRRLHGRTSPWKQSRLRGYHRAQVALQGVTLDDVRDAFLQNPSLPKVSLRRVSALGQSVATVSRRLPVCRGH